MDPVLLEMQGDGIHTFVPQCQIPKFKPLLVDGHVYYLQHFEVSPVIRPSRSTIHRFELMDNVTDKTYLAGSLLL